MSITINDPTIQAQLQADFNEGRVPTWNPNDEPEAQAFVAYYNSLFEDGVNPAQLVTKTTYEFIIVPPES